MSNHDTIETATVGELIAKLSQFPQNTKVAYTHESHIFPVDLDQINIVNVDEQNYNRNCGTVVLLDAETFEW